MPEWRLRLLPLPPSEDKPGNLTQLSGRLLERDAVRRTGHAEESCDERVSVLADLERFDDHVGGGEGEARGCGRRR